MEKFSVGIDLGTTNSVCCTVKNGKFEFLKFKGKSLLPSAIIFQDGKIVVGENARRKSVIYSENFIKSSKTFMGDFEKIWNIEDRDFTPTDVATEILSYIKKEVENFFRVNGETTAVITVPAYFTANQINETKIAGEQAGFLVKQIITEPVAAAIAYGFEDELDQKIFVVDIGGGTFDVSILKVQGNKYQTIAIDGDKKLGGDNFDEIIMEMCLRKIRQTAGVNLSILEKSGLSKEDFCQAKQRLIMDSENKKIELSDIENVDIEIPNLFTYKGKQNNFSIAISRKEFEEQSKNLLDKIKKIMRKCLDDSGMKSADIDKIILVGGMAYMPAIKDYVVELFGKNPYSDKDLSTLVAMGAALVADSEEDTIIVRDIISHSLGIEVIGEYFEKILIKNEQYPIEKAKIFTTTFDYQKEVEINIFEGEDENVVDNNEFYGSFILDNIEQALKEIPQIEVAFAFDKSRDLFVTARDLQTGSQKSKKIIISKGAKREKPRLPAFDIALLLDTSSSMSGTKIETAKNACCEFVTSMIDLSFNNVALISFESTSEILCHLTNNEHQLINGVKSLYSAGGTDMTLAIENAVIALDGSLNKKIIILVTDGQDLVPFSTPEKAQMAKNRGIRLMTIGVGQDVDSNYLTNLASCTSDYYFIDDISKLRNIFKTIANALKRV